MLWFVAYFPAELHAVMWQVSFMRSSPLCQHSNVCLMYLKYVHAQLFGRCYKTAAAEVPAQSLS